MSAKLVSTSIRHVLQAGIAICFGFILGNASGTEPTNAAPPAQGSGLVIINTKWDPISAYRERRIQGWRVLVNDKLIAETNLCGRTMKLLNEQLEQIVQAVPAGPVQRLRDIPIWVERSSKQFDCMCYHESYEWLRTHDVNPEKAGGVEIANPEKFLTWTKEQPWMVLHELTHGYHKRTLGDSNPGIKRCYESAKASKKYDAVLRSSGKTERHYAMNNEKEYFAEATEAFFGRNDFYPFIRPELKSFDPQMFNLLIRVWEVQGVPEAAMPTTVTNK